MSPMNLVQDDARPLGNNKISIAGAYAITNHDDVDVLVTRDRLTENYFLRLGYGLTKKTTLSLGYHHKGVKTDGHLASLKEGSDIYYRHDNIDVAAKFTLDKHKTLATQTRLGIYLVEGIQPQYSWYNSIIYTRELWGILDASIVFHATLMLDGKGDGYRGTNINVGFSPNRSRWVIRPEVGLSAGTATAGIGAELKLGKKVKKRRYY